MRGRTTAAIRLAGARDVGAGLLNDRDRSAPRLRLLSGSAGLAIRLVRPTAGGWWTAIALSALLFGLIARSAGSTISGSSAQGVLAKLGASGTGTDAVLGVCFLMLAVLIAFAGVGQVTAARAEEASQRLDHLLAGPVSRSRWLGGRLLVALVVLLASGPLLRLVSRLPFPPRRATSPPVPAFARRRSGTSPTTGTSGRRSGGSPPPPGYHPGCSGTISDPRRSCGGRATSTSPRPCAGSTRSTWETWAARRPTAASCSRSSATSCAPWPRTHRRPRRSSMRW